MKKNPPLWCLHGFLGQSSDWNKLAQELPEWRVLCPPELQPRSKLPQKNGLWSFAESFNASLHLKGGPKPVLMGYSLGGRLALHCVLQDALLFEKLVVISAHPGLKFESEKNNRLAADEMWASAFETRPWNDLMKDWNNQSVFGNIPPPFLPREAAFDRLALAKILREWSLGWQEDLSDRIAKLKLPILWITGEQDQKFSSLAQEISKRCPHVLHRTIPNAGHRVPWEQSQIFKEELESFLAR